MLESKALYLDSELRLSDLAAALEYPPVSRFRDPESWAANFVLRSDQQLPRREGKGASILAGLGASESARDRYGKRFQVQIGV